MPQISAAPQNLQNHLSSPPPASQKASPSLAQSSSIWCSDCFQIDSKPSQKLIPPQVLFGAQAPPSNAFHSLIILRTPAAQISGRLKP